MMDGSEYSEIATENKNVKKKRRSILKITSNANNEREALKVQNIPF